MKTCHMCKASLAEAEFYRNSTKPDGLTCACKTCHRAWRKDHYRRNKTRVILSNRAWDRAHPEAVRAHARKHNTIRYGTAEGLQMHAIYQRVRIAQRSGVIKAQPCRICGSLRAVAHHQDYSKPLEVLWYCKKHHSRLHALVGSRRQTLPARHTGTDSATPHIQGIDGAEGGGKGGKGTSRNYGR